MDYDEDKIDEYTPGASIPGKAQLSGIRGCGVGGWYRKDLAEFLTRRRIRLVVLHLKSDKENGAFSVTKCATPS